MRHTTGIKYEVFVVDNGTTKDNALTELPRKYPWITLLANDRNRGFSQANNRGIDASRGRYVLLLNNDTVQTENALGKAVAYMDQLPDVGALGILHLNNDATHSPQDSVFKFSVPATEVTGLLGLSTYTPPPKTVPPEGDVDWVCGSFLMMRRECLAAVGKLDERFFHLR